MFAFDVHLLLYRATCSCGPTVLGVFSPEAGRQAIVLSWVDGEQMGRSVMNLNYLLRSRNPRLEAAAGCCGEPPPASASSLPDRKNFTSQGRVHMNFSSMKWFLKYVPSKTRFLIFKLSQMYKCSYQEQPVCRSHGRWSMSISDEGVSVLWFTVAKFRVQISIRRATLPTEGQIGFSQSTSDSFMSLRIHCRPIILSSVGGFSLCATLRMSFRKPIVMLKRTKVFWTQR